MGVSRDAKRVLVLIDGRRRYDAHARIVERHTGSIFRDSAEIEIANIGPNDTVDTAFEITSKFENSLCQVGIRNRSGSRVQWIHYGRIVGGQYEMSESGSSIILSSRFEDHLLGEPLSHRVIEVARANGQRVPVIQTLERELVFNPRYEGRTYGNKTFGFNLNLLPMFIDLNGIDLNFLTLPQTSQFVLWSLADAVYYLCYDLNSSESHVNNPTWTELIQVLPRNVFLNNFALPVGVYLGEALDSILNPFGYHWKITHDSSKSRKIEVFSKDKAYRNVIRFRGHTPLTNFDDNNDKLPTIDIRVDNGDKVFNRVTVIGARKRSETTIELLPDWDKTLENKPILSFVWDSKDMVANPNLRYVYRKFKADLSILSVWNITNNTAARRPMLPCLSLDLTGQPYGTHRGVHIEFSLNGGETWNPLDSKGVVGGLKQSFSCEIIENEPAIIFTGKIFPAYARKYGDNFKVRATATFERDDCLQVTVDAPLAGLPLRDVRELVVSAPDRFQLYERSTSLLRNVTSVSAEIDTSAEMLQFANEILNSHMSTKISGRIVLHGIDNIDQDYLGGSVQELPRSVFLKTSPFRETYPVCTQVQYAIDDQKTVLTIGEL